MASINDLLNLALEEIGYLEKRNASQLDSKTANAGSANYTKYGRDLHALYPSIIDYPAAWCDCFVDWCFYKTFGITNAKALLGGRFDDYTPNSAQLYKNKGAWHTKNPQKGDQIFFHNGVRIYHTGLVYRVSASTVYTIEGNTSAGIAVIPNGGGVYKKSYTKTNPKIAGYGRPNYVYYETPDLSNCPAVSTTASGVTVCATKLNVRRSPSGLIIGTLSKGNRVALTHRYGYGLQTWFAYQDGWISGRYLTGWIKESNKWWYLNPGYTYKTSAWQKIENLWYYFDSQGWMASYCYIPYKDHYCWVNKNGAWETQWDTQTPDLTKYKLCK